MKTKPVYQYVLRGFSYQPDGWHVSGQSEHAGAGVLEWCFSKEDAEDVIFRMQKDKRFSNLKVDQLYL